MYAEECNLSSVPFHSFFLHFQLILFLSINEKSCIVYARVYSQQQLLPLSLSPSLPPSQASQLSWHHMVMVILKLLLTRNPHPLIGLPCITTYTLTCQLSALVPLTPSFIVRQQCMYISSMHAQIQQVPSSFSIQSLKKYSNFYDSLMWPL